MPRVEREYERIKTSVENQAILRSDGFSPVFSSNVSAIARRGTNLIIRFHNGSLYQYPQQGDRFNDLLTSPSKGEWVWDNLRRTRVPYAKIGSMPLDGDRDMTDDELIAELARQNLLVQAIKQVASSPLQISPIQAVAGISSIEQLTAGILLTSFLF